MEEDIADTISTDSGAAEPEAETRAEVLKTAMKTMRIHLGYFAPRPRRVVWAEYRFCSHWKSELCSG